MLASVDGRSDTPVPRLLPVASRLHAYYVRVHRYVLLPLQIRTKQRLTCDAERTRTNLLRDFTLPRVVKDWACLVHRDPADEGAPRLRWTVLTETHYLS
jgi:hypothetical protein